MTIGLHYMLGWKFLRKRKKKNYRGRQNRNAYPMGGFLGNLFPLKLILVSTFDTITLECDLNVFCLYLDLINICNTVITHMNHSEINIDSSFFEVILKLFKFTSFVYSHSTSLLPSGPFLHFFFL